MPENFVSYLEIMFFKFIMHVHGFKIRDFKLQYGSLIGIGI